MPAPEEDKRCGFGLVSYAGGTPGYCDAVEWLRTPGEGGEPRVVQVSFAVGSKQYVWRTNLG